jgi:hypothetical protein
MSEMPKETLWEAICRLAGKDGNLDVHLPDAIDNSAVPEVVAVVEIRLMIEDGLLERDEDTLRLTERGRRACSEIKRVPGFTGVEDADRPSGASR